MTFILIYGMPIISIEYNIVKLDFRYKRTGEQFSKYRSPVNYYV